MPRKRRQRSKKKKSVKLKPKSPVKKLTGEKAYKKKTNTESSKRASLDKILW